MSNNINSLSFEVDCTCLSRTLQNEGSPCNFSSFKAWENKHGPVEERGVGKENGLVGS